MLRFMQLYVIFVFEKLFLGISGSFLPTFLESSPSTFFDARPLYLSEGTKNCFHVERGHENENAICGGP